MKLISFDIGIKNMAYCILSSNDNTDTPIVIHDWNVTSMIEDMHDHVHSCTCMIPGKNKKTEPKLCNKTSKYQKNSHYFCERHAKTNNQWIIPTKKHTLSYIKKQKVTELVNLCNSHMLLLQLDAKNLKKDQLIEILSTFYTEHCYQPIVSSKTKTANEVDLIHIGRSIKRVFNQLADIDSITHVLIENQISPIATRMKTIQGMLAQYFIMIHDNIHIEFVSSSHKLNQFKDLYRTDNINHVSVATVTDNSKTNPQYKIHKSDGITYCRKIIENNPGLTQWNYTMNTPKKDDLADAFLQGLWYFKHKNIIFYADDLNIKHV